jgi:hypothetical protein
MKRLRQDLINKSKMVKSSSQTMTLSSETKVQKIANAALRGGYEELNAQELQNLHEVYRMLDRWAEQEKMSIIRLLAMLNDIPKDNKILNLIFGSCRAYLHLILLIWKINLTYIIDPRTAKTIVATIISGGIFGVIGGVWFGVACTLIVNGIGTVCISQNIFNSLIVL